MNRIASSAVLIAAIAAVSCSDPLGPCDARHACEVEGIDLAVLDVKLLETNRTGTDHVTGLPIYALGEIVAIATIVNRGDSVAPPAMLSNGRTVPSLEPGEVFRDTVRQTFSAATRLNSGADPRMADVRTLMVMIPWGETLADADETNNEASSAEFHVAIPVIEATMELAGQATELRANAQFALSFTLRNRSMHGGALESTDAVLCMIDFDIGCWYHWPYFGRFEVPRIEAGAQYQDVLVTSFPPEATIFPDEAHDGGFAMCLVSSDLAEPYMPALSPCVAGLNMTVRPDYSACSPPVAQLGTPLTLTTPNCEMPDRQDGAAWSVVALDAVAGQSYTIPYAGHDFVVDANGNHVSLPVAQDGRYYIVVYHSAPVTLTVTGS